MPMKYMMNNRRSQKSEIHTDKHSDTKENWKKKLILDINNKRDYEINCLGSQEKRHRNTQPNIVC